METSLDLQYGLYQNKVTTGLASNLGPGHETHNCKMAYSCSLLSIKIQGDYRCLGGRTERGVKHTANDFSVAMNFKGKGT